MVRFDCTTSYYVFNKFLPPIRISRPTVVEPDIIDLCADADFALVMDIEKGVRGGLTEVIETLVQKTSV